MSHLRFTSIVILAAILFSGIRDVNAQIRETHGSLTYINVRVDPAVAQAMLPPGLTADTYDGSAWVTYLVDQIVENEFNLFGLWVPFLLSPMWVARTYMPVYHTTHDADAGLLLLTLDTEPGLNGFTSSLGCSLTQTGVQCNQAKSFTTESPTSPPGLRKSLVTMKQDATFSFSGTYVRTNPADMMSPLVTPDPAFASWIVNRSKTYTLGANNQPKAASAEGRGDAANMQGLVSIVTGVSGTGLESTMLSARFPAMSALESSQVLAKACNPALNGNHAYCFTAPNLRFVAGNLENV
eukprot:PhM_4_TR292/c0_g1_i2/m.27807